VYITSIKTRTMLSCERFWRRDRKAATEEGDDDWVDES